MKVLALIAAGAVILPAVRGHGYISDPAAQWVDGYATNGYGSTVDNEIWGTYDNSVYGYGVAATVAFFEDQFPDSGYDSLGQFIIANQVLYDDSVDEQCGYTVYDDSARSTLPSTNLTYTGFTHQGPCEVWCDDTKVLFEYDCSATYPDIPAGMPYDESLCADANRMTVYWLALHGDPWQAYVDCVWLEGGSGSGSAPAGVTEAASTTSTSTTSTTSTTSSSGSTTSTTDSTATTTSSVSSSSASTANEASTTSATTTTTTAPTSTTATPTATTSAPATTTAAPSTSTSTTETETATETPSTTEKCTASARRHRRRRD